MIDPFSLPFNVSSRIFSSWLDLKSVVSVDSAVCNHSTRGQFIQILSCKALVHQNPVLLRGTKMLQWLCSRSFRIAAALFGVETKESRSLVKYFAPFGDSIRCIHFRDKCKETEMMCLVACYCKNITTLRCTNVILSLAFHAILRNNPNIHEIWVGNATCMLDGLMDGLSLHNLELFSVQGTDCLMGFPWSDSAHSDSLQRVKLDGTLYYYEDMKALTLNCRNLRSLSWKRMNIIDSSLISYLSNMSALLNLDMSNNGLVTDATVLFVAQNLHCLRSLNLQKCSNLTILSLSYVADYCTVLEVLYIDFRIAGNAMEHAVKTFSTRCNKIAHLNINSAFVLCNTMCSLFLIKGCPALQTLVINKYENITPTSRELCALVKPQLKILVHDQSTEYNVLTMPV